MTYYGSYLNVGYWPTAVSVSPQKIVIRDFFLRPKLQLLRLYVDGLIILNTLRRVS